MVDFHGWMLPVQYEGILAEHRQCREAAVLFDTSHMGQFLVRGAGEVLGRITTQDAAGMPVGSGRYGFLLSEAGGIRDDTILMRLGEAEFLLVVNAGPAERDFEWVGSHLPDDAELVNLSADGWGKVDLQGPAAAKVLAPATDVDLRQLGYFRVTRGSVCGRRCVVSRTGYTGELGYEIFAAGDDIAAIFAELVGNPAVKPAGLGARDSLRLEMGYPLYGDDIDENRDPFSAGLERFVDVDRAYVGAEALRRVTAQRRLVAFAAAGRQRAWRGSAICRDGRAVGEVTSAAFSPSLNVAIGMGYVFADFAAPGTELTVQTPRAELPITVREKPLYERGSYLTDLTKEL